MAKVHGSKAYISVSGVDISAYGTSLEYSRSVDVHDTTTFGATAHTYKGGLKDGSAALSGYYEDGTSNTPRLLLEGWLGESVAIVERPEGTGSGLPERQFNAVVGEYGESAPVAEMRQWTCALTITGDVTSTSQGA